MRVKEKKKAQQASVGGIAAVVFICFLVCVFLDSNGIRSWASRMNIGTWRSILLTIVTPLDAFSRSLGLDAPGRTLRSAFFSLSGMVQDAGFATSSGASTAVSDNAPVTAGVTVSEAPTPEKSSVVFSVERPLRILFLGDSMIEGAIYVMFARSVFDDKSIQCSIKARHSTGLSRPDYYDWPKEAENVFAGREYDCAVVLMGTNDAQDFTVDGKPHHFNSPEWLDIYRKRATQFISYLNGNIPVVYWIGLPRMRMERFDESMRILNGIYSSVCGMFKRVKFIPTAGPLGDQNGNYTDYTTMNGKIEYFRSADGIHLLYPAGKIVSDLLLAEIRKDFTFEPMSGK